MNGLVIGCKSVSVEEFGKAIKNAVGARENPKKVVFSPTVTRMEKQQKKKKSTFNTFGKGG